MELVYEEYTQKSFVIRGNNTKMYKEQLKKLGGKWNANLRDGAGWVFPKAKQNAVLEFMQTGKLPEPPKRSTFDPDSDLLKQIENLFTISDLQARLDFVARVARLASTTPQDEKMKKVEKSPLQVKEKQVKPKPKKPVPKQELIIEDDEYEFEDEEQNMVPLL